MRVRSSLRLSSIVLAVACSSSSDSGGPDGGTATTDAQASTDARPGVDAAVGSDAPPITVPGSPSAFIVVDQFGYRPADEKIAVVRDPQTGFDASASFTPGAKLAVVDARGGQKLLEAAPVAWNGGATDASSGDRAWWFDFSSVTQAGDYYILDESKNVRSDVFHIADDVYRDVLAQATRMLFYQRDGFEKKAQFAGAGWADGASHMGALQDTHCRLYSKTGDAATEKDLHGGWYDAGDLNKYTSWTAGYVVTLLRAYVESPTAFRDDTGIPESGNGVADVLDETRWGLDWLVRMQNDDGSVLAIVGEDSHSPPSAATGQSLYGSASTTATVASAAAYAYGAIVFRSAGSTAYADDLTNRAKKAWSWANANPNVRFYNNDQASGTVGLGAGQQEVDDYGRLSKKLGAAVYLYELTGDTQYRDFFDANYGQMRLIASSYAYPFELEQQDNLLEYTRATGATAAVVKKIKDTYKAAIAATEGLGALRASTDPYGAYLKDYVWGSNQTKSAAGDMLYDVIVFGIDSTANSDAARGAERYVHYLHGVNPLRLVYLSNMGGHGASSSVTKFFHTWYAHGSALWDTVGVSTYGPPPGYLVGGPNPGYSWDGCCPSGCSGVSCGAAVLSPPSGQPPQKSYLDFNDSWPIDSWSVTEPSDGYQVAYIRLLSKFAK